MSHGQSQTILPIIYRNWYETISRHHPFLYDGSSPKPFVAEYPLTDPRTEHYSPENPPDDDAVVNLFQFWRKNPILEPRSFHYHETRFRNWLNDCYSIEHENYVSAIRSVIGAKGRASQKIKKSKRHADSGKPDKQDGARSASTDSTSPTG
jgi:hypothetical protein